MAGAEEGAGYARVAVEVEPDHLDRPFDYRIPEELRGAVGVGSRVEVVFGGRRLRGLVLEVVARPAIEENRTRDLRRVFGEHPWVLPDELDLLRWASTRYAAPLAAVIRHALPNRVVSVERRAADAGWFPAAPRPADPGPPPVDEEAWDLYETEGARPPELARTGGGGGLYWRPLPDEDLGARLSELVGLTLAGGRDVLLIVPEPVSAAADAVAAAHPGPTVDVRGDRGATATYRAWLEARTGRARVVIGERGAAFWPLSRLGLAVVVDEASPALKERRSPRHHAREVALERARRAGAVGLLVGAVPSAAAWRLMGERRLRTVIPQVEAERRSAPLVRVDDRGDPRNRGRLGGVAPAALRAAVGAGGYGVVLASRRGEGRVLLCTACSLMLTCPRCGAALDAEARGGGDLAVRGGSCGACGWRPRGRLSCERCDGQRFAPLAAGAQRLADELARAFPGVVVAALEGYAQAAPPAPAILVMTRGSAMIDPPGPVGAVVLPDLDPQLRRPVLDAAEDALRLALRVAAWTVRAPVEVDGDPRARAEAGPVVVVTREPTHHAVQALVRWDPGGFWRTEAQRRTELRFPPVAYAIRLDVAGDGVRVVDDLAHALPADDEVLGPRPEGARSSVLVKSAEREASLEALAPLREAWSRDGLDVRVDVDPVDVM